MRLALALGFALAAVQNVGAQIVNQAGQAIDTYELRLYAPGASAPMTSSQIDASATTCNLAAPPPATPPVVNPTLVIWDDPQNASRVCQWTPGGQASGTLVQLPDGAHEAVVVSIYMGVAGPESPRVPFSRVVPRPAPTGLRLIRPVP